MIKRITNPSEFKELLDDIFDLFEYENENESPEKKTEYEFHDLYIQGNPFHKQENLNGFIADSSVTFKNIDTHNSNSIKESNTKPEIKTNKYGIPMYDFNKFDKDQKKKQELEDQFNSLEIMPTTNSKRSHSNLKKKKG